MDLTGAPDETASMAMTAEVMGDTETINDLDEAEAEIAAGEGDMANDPWRQQQAAVLALLPEVVQNQRRLLMLAEDAVKWAETVREGALVAAKEYREIAGAWGRLGRL